MKQFILTFFFLPFASVIFAQSGTVSGRVVSNATQAPVPELELELIELKTIRFTDQKGEFSFSDLPYGTYKLSIGDGINASEIVLVKVDKEQIALGDIAIQIAQSTTSVTPDQLPSIGLEEATSTADDDGINSENYSPVLTAYRDPFLSAAAYTFGPLRYQLRGYFRSELEVYMNYIPMNDVESGSAFWGQWGGLNDVFRNQNNAFALAPMEVGFGGLQGGTAIDATAASQRQQTRVTYSNSNRSYRHRVMLTHSTGMMSSGWAFSASASRRWANEGYIPGTFYDGYSYYLGISKKINSKTLLHFTTFGAPTSRGKAMPSTQEAMDLAGDNYYNPNWGWQNGEKRNARVNNTFQPAAILTLEHNKSVFESLNISLAYQTGYNGNTSLDWYNAQDPRPDYYRKLPSFYLYDPAGAKPDVAERIRQELEGDPDKLQIDWAELYAANILNSETINGITGRRSVYVIGEDRDDINRISFATNYKKVFGEHFKFYTGISYQLQTVESYRRMVDLLGGDFWVNHNQFAERTYVGNNDLKQNDLNNPDALVKEEDKYMYDYKSVFHKGYWWGQAVFNYGKIDFFLTARLGMEAFQREGLYKNGLFVDESFGKSDMQSFFTYAVKGGLTYKIDGKNFVYLNGAYSTNAPVFDNTFVSPRVRNTTIANPLVEKSATVEGGYLLHTPYLNGRISAFATDFKDITNIKRFYHEDYRTFVNYVMTDIGIRNLGTEMALQVKISPSLSATAVATWTQVFYTTRPNVSVYRDNDTIKTAESHVAYMENYYVPSGPQSAYSIGLNYRSPKFWWLNVNFNYLDRNYMEVNPTRLTESAVDLMDRNSAEFRKIVQQEQFPAFYTVDVFTGKSFALDKIFKGLKYGTMLYINIGVNNVTNNKEVITGGFNQLRFDISTRNPDRFPPKYFYGLGINYFVNVSFKF